MLKEVKRTLASHLTLGLLGPKRPPGPSYFDLQDEPLQDPSYSSLEYPLKLTEKYGDFTYIRSAFQYVVAGPEGFLHILKTNTKNYIKKNFFYNRIRFLFGHSLLTGDGEFWKERRKIAKPSFQLGMMQHYAPTIQREIQNFIATQQRHFAKQHPAPVNILELMNQLTLKIALQLFTGENLPDNTLKTLSASIYYANHYVSNALFIAPWKPTLGSLRFHWHMKNMDHILLDLIRSKREKFSPLQSCHLKMSHPMENISQIENPPTLLSNLIHAIHDFNETGTRLLTDHEILAEFKTLLLTGHETTGCALTFALYLLALHPVWQTSLANEFTKVLGDPLRPIELQDLARLPILNAVFQETLRLYPPIWSFARSNLEDDTLCGYKIPKNSLIVLNLYALQRNPRYWIKPNQFRPLRFLPENAKDLTPYSFLPFSTGPRTCIASQLGTQEALLILGSLIQHFRFEKSYRTKVDLEPCISLRPKNGLWLKIIPKG